MQTSITAFRADLKRWLEAAKAGDEVIITDRGVAVARLVGIDASPILERLEAEGLLTLPRSAQRTIASGRRRAAASRAVSDLVSEHRS